MAQALSGIADVNVFIAAFRTDHLSHERCAAWLDRQGTGSGQFGINSVVLSGAMRVLTNPRIFVDPASSSEAADFCQAIVDCPNAVVIEPGPKHWGIFMDLVLSTATSHRLIPDAWFAALAIEAECPWISLDQDFGLFPGLDWRQP